MKTQGQILSGLSTTRDSMLVERALRWQKGGATFLYCRYRGMVRKIVSRASRNTAVMDELVQEAFLNAFRSLSTLENRSRLRAWLAGVARFVGLKHMRDRHEERCERLLDEGTSWESFADTAAGNPEALASSGEVRRLVDQMEEPFRSALVYRFIDDLPVAEVARRQGIKTPLAKYRIRQGRLRLKEKLQVAGYTTSGIE